MSSSIAGGNAELFKRLQPQEYFEQFLAEGIYPDGRDVAQFRQTAIECGGPSGGHSGSAHVHQGGAYVSCTAQLSLAPDSDDPLVQWEVEAMDTIPKDLIEHAESHLAVLFSDNQLLDASELRVQVQTAEAKKQFELRWTVHLQIVVLSSDGLLLDAILTAVQAALLDIRIPTRVEYADMGAAASIFEGDDDFLLGEEVPLHFEIEKVRLVDPEEESRGIVLKQFLVYVPFLLYRSAKCTNASQFVLLCDPSSELCAVVRDRCEMILGPNGAMHSLSFSTSSKDGPLPEALLDEMMVLAKRRHTAVGNALRECAARVGRENAQK